MAVYTKLEEREIRHIASQYGLTMVGYETVARGAANSNYLVRTHQGRFVLTVLEDKAFNRAAELGRLLQLLKKHAFPTSALLLAKNGAAAILHRDKPVMVKAYLEGAVRRELSRDMLRQVGRAMARLHQVPAPTFLADRQPYGVRKLPIIQKKNIDEAYESYLIGRISSFAEQDLKSMPRGLIHGDIFYDNVLFEGSRLKGIIDFEEALYGEKAFDLAMGMVGVCRTGEAVDLEKARALVKGYEQIRRLETVEKRALQLLVEYAALTVSCWRYWKYHIDAPNADKDKVDKHRRMARVAEKVRDTPKRIWLDALFGR